MRQGLFHVQDCVTLDGGIAANEDLAGSTGDFAWVLDGATPISDRTFFSAHDDAEWIVKAFDKIIRQTISEDRTDNSDAQWLWEVLRIGFTRLAAVGGERHPFSGIQKHELPTFAMAMVHFGPDCLDYALLADCEVVIDTDIGVVSYTDQRFESVRRSTLARYLQLVDRYGRPRTLTMLRDQLSKNRSLMNIPGGHYVGTLDPACAETAVVGSLPVTKIRQVLLCTDGFARVVTLFRALSWADLFSGTSLSEATRVLRECEANDTACRAYPRVKVSDDATALLLRRASF
jgi:hypothetical protein